MDFIKFSRNGKISYSTKSRIRKASERGENLLVVLENTCREKMSKKMLKSAALRASFMTETFGKYLKSRQSSRFAICPLNEIESLIALH